MSRDTLAARVRAEHEARYGRPPEVVAYAPGRVEILGNHTDYNEGLVLAAAIDAGTCVAVSRDGGPGLRVWSGHQGEERVIGPGAIRPDPAAPWTNYVRGVVHGLVGHGFDPAGLCLTVSSDIPLGAGLSSSAAFEVATALALARVGGLELDRLTVARLCKRAEHEFAGVRCGLLDQLTSLAGEADALVALDFREVTATPVPLDAGMRFVLLNTRVSHALVDGEYNQRRAQCEAAREFFAGVLDRPVTALRDVTWDDWQARAPKPDPQTAARAAHVIGENERVTRGRAALGRGDFAEFGALMSASHDSSRLYFENSCRELDFLVAEAARTSGVLGARLSGGGFGGSVVALVEASAAESAGQALADAYHRRFGSRLEPRIVRAEAGAGLV